MNAHATQIGVPGMKRCRNFLTDEAGAVTVDWVVLTASVTLLAVVALQPIKTAVVNLVVSIAATLDGIDPG